MREILYKAKRRKDYGNPKEWVYGVPCLDKDGDWSIVTHNMSRVVQDETICEYTGMKDINNNRIFENDIICYTDAGKHCFKGIVRFGQYSDNRGGEHIGFYVEWQGDMPYSTFRKDLGFWYKMVEVSINIFDNEVK